MVNASILALPPELLAEITKRCSYATALALQYTCRELYAKVASSKSAAALTKPKRDKSYTMDDLLEIEKWPCYDFEGQAANRGQRPRATLDFFACSYCLKIRCASRFSKAMMKGGRSKRPPVRYKTARDSRFCLDCGVAFRRYLPGTYFDFGEPRIADGPGGSCGIVCYGCREFKRIYSQAEYGNRTCQACLASTEWPP
jgi:hypothetical protein